MRHSPIAYKYEKPSLRGFYKPRTYLAEKSAKVQSINAFGLKLVERSAFMADKQVPISAKRNMRDQVGSWVLYLPSHERTCLFVGDNPSTLVSLACAHMSQLGV